MPSFMQDGRLIFTAEKREPGFYQLALRRQNLDGSDYHPLYAQRATIGYPQATGVVELADKNFATIFSNQGALHGAGALVVFNRSIGVDFTSQNPKDYLIDPDGHQTGLAVGAGVPNFFLHSLDLSLPMDGSYTSPFAAAGRQDARQLRRWALRRASAATTTSTCSTLRAARRPRSLGASGTAEVDAVAVYGRVPKGLFVGTADEPNGNTTVHAGETVADITVLDMTVLGSLLFQNTPTGRPVEPDLRVVRRVRGLAAGRNHDDLVRRLRQQCRDDAYGKVYMRRRKRGTVPVQGDGSVHFRIPGGHADGAAPRGRQPSP